MKNYKELNEEGREYFLNLIKEEKRDAKYGEYLKEINQLYADGNILPLLQYLHICKERNTSVDYSLPTDINKMKIVKKVGLNIEDTNVILKLIRLIKRREKKSNFYIKISLV